MRIRTFRGVLDECLEAVRRGESVESCLARYPRHAERLRPLLTLATRIRTTPPAEPRPWAKATAWDVVRQRAAELRGGRRRGGISFSFGMWLRPIAVAVALVMAVTAGSGATVLASQNALPDSPLYRVKLISEDVHLWFVYDDSNEAEILLDQSDERLEEILAMARDGKTIPSNVLSAMEDRHSRASEKIHNLDTADSERSALLGRLVDQAAVQEDTLLTLWDVISPGGRDEYTSVVAVLHNTRLQGSTEFVLSPDDLAGGIRQIEGEVTRVSDNVWSIGGIEVTIDERTIGARELQDGATAAGVFARSVNGQLQALSLISTGSPPAFVSGEIEEVSANGIVVAGQFIEFDGRAIVPDNLKPGDPVELEISSSGEVARATSVTTVHTSGRELEYSLTLIGTIESEVSDVSQWTVSGVTFEAPETVRISAGSAKAAPGARALVEASFRDDKFVAKSLTVLNGTANPDEIYVIGTFQEASAGQWFVSGVGFNPPPDASEPAPGSLVSVDGLRAGNQLNSERWLVLEQPDEDPLARVMGTLQSMNGANWDVGIGRAHVNPNAQVDGVPEEGLRVLMWGRKNNANIFDATYVRVLDLPAAGPGSTPNSE